MSGTVQVKSTAAVTLVEPRSTRWQQQQRHSRRLSSTTASSVSSTMSTACRADRTPTARSTCRSGSSESTSRYISPLQFSLVLAPSPRFSLRSLAEFYKKKFLVWVSLPKANILHFWRKWQRQHNILHVFYYSVNIIKVVYFSH